MPRVLPGVVGFVLAIAVVVPAPRASGQILSRLRRQQPPAQKGLSEVDAITSDEHQRLAEMKVALALLSDIATFPYDFTARAQGKTLELRGNVPNEMVRQRAMDLARRNTFLRGIDVLTIQPKLSVRSTLRLPSIVQQEGAELLYKELGTPAQQIALEVGPNGVIVLTGRTDCVESKLEISRLFRRLPGCNAVVNELTIEPIMLNGQRLVRITRNNLLLVPPSALGSEVEPLPAPPATVEGIPVWHMVERQPAPSAKPQPQPARTPLRSGSLDAHEKELPSPAVGTLKQSSSSTKPAEKLGSGWEAFAPSKLPVKWGRPTESWEAQAKDLAIASPAARQQQQLPKPAKLARTPQSSAPQEEIPTPIRIVERSTETKKTQPSVASKPSRASGGSHLNFTDTREKSAEPAMTWRRPGSNEESEPRASVSSGAKPLADVRGSEKLPPAAASPSRSLRRWPPAYVTGTKPGEGQPGVIDFDEESEAPKAKPKPGPTVIATSRSLAPADLQRQIKSLCGRQARQVVAAVQRDGTVLVRVKVANRSIEDQLSRKILALPEMSSPQIRLMMEIGP